ncbi:MAG: hypothetical protein CME63_12045 [Halobacteriovoraceae bacterium]|jgi:hypothetical protein|nr:hypothetical protein [Halobacteriovoraceae bacterium]MBC98474.1 hypothetical protein [Halobacteriovoraceae bacterium]|tara:strand:- start:13891 stop:14748 length:858 start_codon:yes stop_codon:yes gene_type:complete
MLNSSNFIKLSLDEMTIKLGTLEKQKEMMKIWIRGEEAQLYRVSNFYIFKSPERRVAYLSLFSEGKESDDTYVGKRILFTFNLKEVDYFSEGVVSYDEVHETLVVELDKEFYRSEKRTNERLLTYPHHQVYVYFKVQDEKDESNVIELKREEDKLYLDYKQRQKKELKEKLKEKVSDIEDLVGFRVLDISRSGVAFLVGEDEGKYFSDRAKYSFYVLFDGDLFVVKGAKLVYKVDYVGGKEGKKRFKVGLTFAPVDNLTHYVTELLKEGVETDSIKREFEDFIDD